MNRSVRTKIVKIGNSRGIIIPKALLEQADITDEVEMAGKGNKLVIQSARRHRQDWDAKFSEMANHGDDHLLDEPVSTAWDKQNGG